MRARELRFAGRCATSVALAVGILVLLGVSSAAGASTSPQIVREDVVGMVFENPCTGERITITDGTLQVLVEVKGDSAGGLHIVVHGNAQGVVATGETTGDMYRLAGDFWTEQNIAGGGFPVVVQLVEVHDVLSQGSGENFIVHLLSHLTINADDVVTASVDSVSAECRG
jgi:hypothetical protein